VPTLAYILLYWGNWKSKKWKMGWEQEWEFLRSKKLHVQGQLGYLIHK